MVKGHISRETNILGEKIYKGDMFLGGLMSRGQVPLKELSGGQLYEGIGVKNTNVPPLFSLHNDTSP